jgi:hypothetical protein
MRQLGKSEASKDTMAEKGGESDVASRDLQGGSPLSVLIKDRAVVGTRKQVLNRLITYWIYIGLLTGQEK